MAQALYILSNYYIVPHGIYHHYYNKLQKLENLYEQFLKQLNAHTFQ